MGAQCSLYHHGTPYLTDNKLQLVFYMWKTEQINIKQNKNRYNYLIKPFLLKKEYIT